MTDYQFTYWSGMTDKVLAEKIGNFIKHHRLQQNKSQTELATAAGISRSTLSLLERGEPVNLSTLIQTLRVLDKLQILDIFTIQNQISPIALAKAEKYKRKRARKRNNPGTSESDW